MNKLDKVAREVADSLKSQNLNIVFAESCTCGLLAATLGKIPGISQNFCGSAVTYQNDTKANWLGISHQILETPGPVSEIVARLMAENVLKKTPHADVAVSVTGHLGPDAEKKLDGVVYVGIGYRKIESGIEVTRLLLPDKYTEQTENHSLRLCRLDDLLLQIFKLLLQSLAEQS
tara:strand:+ start:234 stop:758 length:525 start_codon:yes stop_codon:yes gene_type:complete